MKIKLSPTTKQALKKLGVAVVYLFGSRAQGTAFRFSDVDLGVVFFDPKQQLKDSHKAYLAVYQAITHDIPDAPRKPRPDISLLQLANPALGMSAIQYGRVLYEVDPIFRANFEEETFKRYQDYLPLQHEYAQANIDAFLLS